MNTDSINQREAKRAQRVQRRRRQILDAAAHLMQRSGYHAMSIQQLADEAIDLSSGDPVETQLITATDLSESKNNIGHVVVPEEGKSSLIMECSGEATWGDGNETNLKLRLTLDSLGEIYVEYSDR